MGSKFVEPSIERKSVMYNQAAAVLLSALAVHAHSQNEFLAVGWAHYANLQEGKRICMFSPEDGTFIGYLTEQYDAALSSVQGIAYGPDEHVYVANQLNDTVARFTRDGDFVEYFLTGSNGIDNIRGIAFLGDDLLVAHAQSAATSGIDYTASSIKRFAPDKTEKQSIVMGFSSWDIHVLDGDKLVIAEDDSTQLAAQVHVYDGLGNDLSSVFTADWPTGFSDSHTAGNYYGVSYTRTLHEFNETTDISSVTMAIPVNTVAKDVYPLSNGNVLVTTFSDGVHVINPANGHHVLTAHYGYGFGNITLVDALACPADVNGDGMVSPTDFNAWINAFNNNLPECDQNGDNNCTQTDFTAWISNYNEGC
jgi:hypothetical protein